MKKLAYALAVNLCILVINGCGGGAVTSTGCLGASCLQTSVATHFSVISGPNATSGLASNFAVTALDASGNTVSGYAGFVHFTSSDAQALLPPDSKLINGTQSFSVTFKTLGSQSILATDTGNASIFGKTGPIKVVTPSTLVDATGPFPNGAVGHEYGIVDTITDVPSGCSVTFTGIRMRATGGVAPFSWSWSPAPGSSLPPGLGPSQKRNTCGGTTRCCTTVTAKFFGGTPTTAGTYNVIVTVSDSASPQAQASAPYTIVISGSPAAAKVPLARAHSRYMLIDLGTLGGPRSYGSASGDGFRLLNNEGDTAFYSDTSMPDPNAPNSCFDADCFLAHAARWKNGVLTDAGALPGVNSSAVSSMNERGWIVGASQTGTFDPVFGGPTNQAVLWKRTQMVDLGTMDGTSSVAIYVNDTGQVVGIADNKIPDPFSLFGIGVQVRTFLWDDGKVEDIGTLGGPDTVPGAGCNNQLENVIVGQSYTSSSPNSETGIPTLAPFLWKQGKMTDLGSLGGTLGFAQCANNRGEVIGFSNLSGDIIEHAFVWNEDRRMQDLGTLGGDNSEAIWINDAGEIVGSADLAGSVQHDAVLWKDGVIQDLGTVDGDACSRARAINTKGQVVGGSSDCSNFLHGFVWEKAGPMLDLNTLIAPGSGLQITNAFNINDRGEILARSVPAGVTPIDDEDLGHLVLLIPCERNDQKGCEDPDKESDYPAVERAPDMNPAASGASHTKTAREDANAWRSHLARHYHFFQNQHPKN
jgi:probable HAF family extracellular repeat protein